MNIPNLACKKTLPVVLCRPDKRKSGSYFPKWYCYNCRKYVLPDKNHFTIFQEVSEKQLTFHKLEADRDIYFRERKNNVI